MKSGLIYLLAIVLLLTITLPLMAGFPGWVYTLRCDIKPGEYPNIINLKSNGVIAVAIFGNYHFNVEWIDPSSLWFEEAKAVKWSLADINFDGYMDLISHYRIKKTGIESGQEKAIIWWKLQNEDGWYCCSDDICTSF